MSRSRHAKVSTKLIHRTVIGQRVAELEKTEKKNPLRFFHIIVSLAACDSQTCRNSLRRGDYIS